MDFTKMGIRWSGIRSAILRKTCRNLSAMKRDMAMRRPADTTACIDK
jgi:hypothetical protein